MLSAKRLFRSREPKYKLKVLSELASTIEIDKDIPLKRYIRSGKEMLRSAEVYHKEGDIERSYMLYIKYITLFVEKIYDHPAMKAPPVPELAEVKKKLNEVFPIAEYLRAQIFEKYTEEYNILLRNKEKADAEAALEEERRQKEQLDQLMYEQHEQFALQQRQQQAKMAQPKRPEIQLPPPGGISPSNVYPVLLEMENGVCGTPRPKTPPFPTLSDIEVPDIPPRASKPSAFSLGTCGVCSPAFVCVFLLVLSSCFQGFCVVRRAIPAVDRSTKPLPLLSTEPYYSTAQGLRTVVLPGSLVSKFLHIARQNTEKNIETCAIMAGKLAKNQLSISHLLVPRQSGTADDCCTESEELVIGFQDELGLDTIGWIHTHPTQTAFLSSVDLHTHCSYQLMLPESVSIVCAPKYDENKIFSLTFDHAKQASGIKHGDLHEALLTWIKQACAAGINFDGSISRKKAMEIADRLGIADFAESNGRIDRLRKRQGTLTKHRPLENTKSFRAAMYSLAIAELIDANEEMFSSLSSFRGWHLRTVICLHFMDDCAVKFLSHPHSIIRSSKVVEVVCVTHETLSRQQQGWRPKQPPGGCLKEESDRSLAYARGTFYASEDYVGPEDGLDLRKTSCYGISTAIFTVTGFTAIQACIDLVCPKVVKNVVVVCTENEDNARKILALKNIRVNGKEHEVAVYAATEGNYVKGVIRNVERDIGDAELARLIVHQGNPTVRGVKRIKDTGFVVVLLHEGDVPIFFKVGQTINSPLI
ncbi:hypothetical protein MRX96_037388 [Rhipicephalus microplus]